MTIIASQSIWFRKSRATAYSSLNPCDVRSPEMTTTSGSSSFVSVIARSRRLGRKNCCPQCRSESWTIAKGRACPSMGGRLEHPAHGVVEGGRDERRHRQGQQPGDDDVPGDAPLDRRQPADG